MLRTALCLSIASALALLPRPGASFEERAALPPAPGLQAQDPARERGELLVELTLAVARNPTDPAACLRLAAALRAVGRDAEAQRLEDQAAHVSGFCLVRTRKGI